MISRKVSTLVLVAIVAVPHASADTVFLNSGEIEGTVSEFDPDVRLFRGVPFAAPPVDDLRWRPPQPVVEWEGVRKADDWGNRCVQGPVYGPIHSREKSMSEDCLYLNVWAPAHAAGQDLPVYLWFHGGGYVTGSASEPRYDGTYLAKQGIVVVEPNYRLGPFGFLAHPELTEESSRGASGNYGLLDQVAALHWVRENIAAFGGDADNITIGGESAGSLSVSALMASPLSRGLIQKAIGQSGAYFPAPTSDLSLSPRVEAEKSGVEFAASLGVGSLSGLRAVAAKDLLAAAMKIDPYFFGPIVDGYVLQETVASVFEEGAQSRIPLLVGWNSAELGMAIVFNPRKPTPETFPRLLREQFGEHSAAALAVYPAASEAQTLESAVALASDVFMAYSTWKWAEHQVGSGAPVYRYRFDRIGPDPDGANRFGAVHAVEIEYAFNALDPNRTDWEPEDRATARTMAGYWANFIKTGNPNGAGLADWPEFGKDRQVMFLDAESKAGPEQHRKRYRFLDDIAGGRGGLGPK